MQHVVDVTLTRCVLYLLLSCVLAAEPLLSHTITKLGPKKRGCGWGYTAQNVSAELEALPVQWWYNWGNGIPDPAAEAFTAVRHLLKYLYGRNHETWSVATIVHSFPADDLHPMHRRAESTLFP